MAAVISRVVASPVPKTEYLKSQPGQPEAWTENAHEAFIFPRHGIADQVAEVLRQSAKAATRADGFRRYWFIHARTVEQSERNRFSGRGSGARHTECAIGGHVGRRGQNSARPKNRQQIEEEMRADDVRQLEESYR